MADLSSVYASSVDRGLGLFIRRLWLKPVLPNGQGSEFISRDLDLWAYQKDVTLDFSKPGKPTDNALVESFNGKFRVECLNTHWFMSLDDARSEMEE